MRVKEGTIHLSGMVSEFVLCKSDNTKCILVSQRMVSVPNYKYINLSHWRKWPYLDTFVKTGKNKIELNSINIPAFYCPEKIEYIQRFQDAWLGFSRQIS